MNYARHLKANYIEFIEAFCRAVDKASFQPDPNAEEKELED